MFVHIFCNILNFYLEYCVSLRLTARKTETKTEQQ